MVVSVLNTWCIGMKHDILFIQNLEIRICHTNGFCTQTGYSNSKFESWFGFDSNIIYASQNFKTHCISKSTTKSSLRASPSRGCTSVMGVPSGMAFALGLQPSADIRPWAKCHALGHPHYTCTALSGLFTGTTHIIFVMDSSYFGATKEMAPTRCPCCP